MARPLTPTPLPGVPGRGAKVFREPADLANLSPQASAAPRTAYTLINAFKPLTIDDTHYHSVAAQVAQHPLDPYGYAAFWWANPEVANEVLAPPLLPYYWAPAIRLFGERPFLWKLWLFPIAVLFACPCTPCIAGLPAG